MVQGHRNMWLECVAEGDRRFIGQKLISGIGPEKHALRYILDSPV